MRTASVLLSDNQHADAVSKFVNNDFNGAGMVRIQHIFNPLGKRGGFLRGKELKDSYRAFLEQFNLEDWEMQKCIDFLAYRYYSEWVCYLYMVDNQFEGIIAFADWQ